MNKPHSSHTVTVLVTGDIVVDHHLYLDAPCDPFDGASRNAGTLMHVEFGGAALISRLLDTHGDAKPEPWHVRSGLELEAGLFSHSYAVWERSSSGEWRATSVLGYGPPIAEPIGTSTGAACPRSVTEDPSTPDVLIIDDAGRGFNANAACWPKCIQGGELPKWLVWHLSGDLAGGPLWKQIESIPALRERTVLIVSAADMRRAGFDVSRGLSWERSSLEVVEALRSTQAGPLAGSRHVVVSFRGAGVLWRHRSGDGEASATLLFHPASIEGDRSSSVSGSVFGYQACLTGGIAWQLAADPASDDEDLSDGIRRGLQARRLLFQMGHGKDTPRGFPARRIRTEALRNDPQSFSRVELPVGVDARTWTVLRDAVCKAGVSGPLYASAKLVALNGLSALAGMPSLSVNKLATVDRSEIESFRRLNRLVRDYESAGPRTKPLSLAVFGAPGSGKSHIVRELATWVLGKNTKLLEFNLSQLSDDRDLVGAFHCVRDVALSGRTPVVMWDEFDSQEFRWLRLLLAPMQDGSFQEGQIVHPIGKCVFIFVGGTSSTFAEFGPPSFDRGSPDWVHDERVWRLAKGPDFRSRLEGTLDVEGPNQRLQERTRRDIAPDLDPSDFCFPIRRALFLRGVLGLEPEERLEIEPDLLDALLRVPKFTHGSRSFKRILDSLSRGGWPLRAEYLPPRDDLARDVQVVERDPEVKYMEAGGWIAEYVDSFRNRRKRDADARARIGEEIDRRLDEIAKRIHAAYMSLPYESRSADIEAQFSDLAPFVQESNRAAARRVPTVLTAAGLRVVNVGSERALERTQADAWLELFLDLCAAREHDEWMRFHEADGWKKTERQEDPKDALNKRHPALVDWTELSATNKDKDRLQVRIYLAVIYDMGFALAL